MESSFNNIESVQQNTNEQIQETELNLWHQELLEDHEYNDTFKDFPCPQVPLGDAYLKLRN